MQWTADNIVRATGGRMLYGAPGQRFNRVGIDSRCVESDMLFVAICGQVHDGHTFIPQVVDSGVRGIVVQADHPEVLDHDRWRNKGVACVVVGNSTIALGALAAYQRKQLQIPVVAITGSNGKTTTRQMTALVMARRYNTLATQGNLNNEIGVPLTLFNLENRHQAAVVELGMNHAGEIDRLSAICQPSIGVIINAGPAHLEFLGSVANVARAKGELLAHIEPDGTAVLNADDPLVAALAQHASGKVLFFGTTAGAQVRAEAIHDGQTGVAFDLCLPEEKTRVQLQTTGRFMVSNALAAAAAGHLTGLAAQEIKAGLEAFTPVAGRLTIKTLPNGVYLIDDTYNANPGSMAAAIDTLDAMKGNARAFVVLGDMLELGSQADALHRQVGQIVAQACPFKLYACGDHADSIVEGARNQGMGVAHLAVGSKSSIVQDLIDCLQDGDWLLVKGSRGMAMETVVAQVCQWATAQSTA